MCVYSCACAQARGVCVTCFFVCLCCAWCVRVGVYLFESFLFSKYVYVFMCVFVYVCDSEWVACLGGLGAAV